MLTKCRRAGVCRYTSVDADGKQRRLRIAWVQIRSLQQGRRRNRHRRMVQARGVDITGSVRDLSAVPTERGHVPTVLSMSAGFCIGMVLHGARQWLMLEQRCRTNGMPKAWKCGAIVVNGARGAAKVQNRPPCIREWCYSPSSLCGFAIPQSIRECWFHVFGHFRNGLDAGAGTDVSVPNSRVSGAAFSAAGVDAMFPDGVRPYQQLRSLIGDQCWAGCRCSSQWVMLSLPAFHPADRRGAHRVFVELGRPAEASISD
ncbi:hypothetical protein JTB14_024771 [Gonioctena quinquepunctata]|nr:hypothetical protein JTB14_024771 [Gonioctena quinquepunctata]